MSVPHLIKCSNIDTLHIHHTGMSIQGQASLLISLPQLQVLVRGGFLCEALEQLEDQEDIVLPRLQLTEFWSSEEYFFHDTRQMDLVHKCCPCLTKMMFQFNKETMPDLVFLTNFQHLSEIHLWGGDFYEDKIGQVLSVIGHQLKVLYLIHTEQVDEKALILTSKFCTNLTTLGFYNVEFTERSEESSVGDFPSPPAEKRQNLHLLLDLKILSMVSECPGRYIVMMLLACLNLEQFKAGIHCPLTDQDMENVLQKNKLEHLQTLNIPVSSQLTMLAVHLILDSCPRLRSIQDLNYWEEISTLDLKSFRENMTEENFDLDAGSIIAQRPEQKHLDDLSDDVMNYLMGN